MARAISELSPKAQAAYRSDPGLAATRQQQVAQSSAPSSSSSSSPAADPVLGMGSFSASSLPGFVKDPLLVALVLIIGLLFYGRYVKPISLSLPGLAQSNAPSVQSYLDQQNRRVALVSDTMPGRIVRANPAKVSS